MPDKPSDRVFISYSRKDGAEFAHDLRKRRERPCGRTEPRDELPPSDHWITSSAVANSVSGMVRPSALAVLRLMTSSIFVTCCTGRSAGFSPLYGALEVKHLSPFSTSFTSFIPVSLFDLESRFFAPTHTCWRPARAGGCQGRPSLWPGGTLSRLQAAP